MSQEHVRRGQVAAVAAQLAAVLPGLRRDLRDPGRQRVGRLPLPILQTVTGCSGALISCAQLIQHQYTNLYFHISRKHGMVKTKQGKQFGNNFDLLFC